MKSANFKKYGLCRLLIVLIGISLTLCSCQFGTLAPAERNDAEANATESKEDGISQTEQEPELPPVLYYHPLTGLACPQAISQNRPIAVCVGNEAASMPQYGLALADVLLEAPVEQGTRFLAFYTDIASAATVGCVRATRDWLMAFANAFDAITVYNGTTDTVGDAETTYPETDVIDYRQNATSGIFHKDPSRHSPNNVMLNGSNTQGALGSSSFRTTVDPSRMPYTVAKEGEYTTPVGASATYIRTSFSVGSYCEFTYNAFADRYMRKQNGAAHTDALNASPLSFENLFFLFCNVSSYSSASGTTFSLDTASGGSGYYISGGKAISILWKTDELGHILFTDASGAPLTVNPGKSYIGVLRVSDKGNLVMN